MKNRICTWLGPFIDWFVAVPRHAKGKVPVFLHLNYAGLEQVAAKKTNHYDLPWDQLGAHGYAFMSARYSQIRIPRNFCIRRSAMSAVRKRMVSRPMTGSGRLTSQIRF